MPKKPKRRKALRQKPSRRAAAPPPQASAAANPFNRVNRAGARAAALKVLAAVPPQHTLLARMQLARARRKLGDPIVAPPMLTDFRAQFPEFSTVADLVASTQLNLAAAFVQCPPWSADDYPLGVLYFAAHLLNLMEMQIAAADISGTGATDIFVGSVSFGERHVMFRQRSGVEQSGNIVAPGEELLAETVYGQIYLILRGRNIVAAMTV